ncbi:MAG: RibD family protein [Alkalinema sp. RL_2_19]|nr:RibD family protein [Alkalinema sp. RL_2_19]
MLDQLKPRPYMTAVLAMSADGKLADYTRSAGRFGSPQDQVHLEARVAEADLVLFGAGTLRAYGTTMSVHTPTLQAMRSAAGKPVQPIQMVCSASGDLDPDCHFFTQPIPRWLLTTTAGAKDWSAPQFDRVWAVDHVIDWQLVMAELAQAGITKIALLGGGKLVASCFAAGLVDEIWLTVCPLILGGPTSPTPVQSSGWLEAVAPRLRLMSATADRQRSFSPLRRQVIPRNSNI